MYIPLKGRSHGRLVGQRHSARQFRQEITRALDVGEHVQVDFDGVEITQSFADELVGALILMRGASVLQHISFRGCSDSVKHIITFVVRDRVAQYRRASSHPLTVMPMQTQKNLSVSEVVHA